MSHKYDEPSHHNLSKKHYRFTTWSTNIVSSRQRGDMTTWGSSNLAQMWLVTHSPSRGAQHS
ncbi:hypothetical protein PsAD2_04094 [Pseudovibrio axinellae]|uniref:Uncharacterized protein n=1 Tax=Pseudovibrio axinellae TaxID=989403 RepID=A0A165U0Z8_9HYPH|nr:hypothetical protein PsAD2_04094 [Pseudovibrio axinellae]SER84963.1 hypothetical protein SAMN05421798_1371 [Pseudovibrio axinellae]